jgi:hypothetical protein
VADSLKATVNRGTGTNRWNIPKFIDMMLLPEYMSRMGSTGRFHCGFAERGLKHWAKMPANTAQKRKGGVFEGQCAARIREYSMIDHAVTAMDNQEGYLEDEADFEMNEGEVGGSAFRVEIIQVEGRGRTRSKEAKSTRYDSNGKIHRQQLALPDTLLLYLKGAGSCGDCFDVRTEAVIGGSRYRAHPNYRGLGPSYAFVTVKFRTMDAPLSPLFYPQDGMKYPAKLVCFFRLLPPDDDGPNPSVLADGDFYVLAHCAAFQQLDSAVYDRKTLLTRSWLYEVTASKQPSYTIVGTVKEPDIVGHVFGFEEKPGFHKRYISEEHKRFIVLSDMRKEWPLVFARLQ